jgi:predicted enzyme related to lactoylglutathione lyase
VPSQWTTFLSVADIEQAEADISKPGSEIMRAPVAVPGVGKLAVASDAT